MTPTKARDLIPEVARSLSLPEEHLANMVSFYYRQNKKLLTNLEHLHVNFNGLGKMTIKGWEIAPYIEKLELLLAKAKEPEEIEQIQGDIERYKKIQVKWVEQVTAKKAVGKEKQKYYDKKLNRNDTKGEAASSME